MTHESVFKHDNDLQVIELLFVVTFEQIESLKLLGLNIFRPKRALGRVGGRAAGKQLMRVSSTDVKVEDINVGDDGEIVINIKKSNSSRQAVVERDGYLHLYS